jgi:diguanylate cyclase (GGDEF)-like protein
MAAGAAALAAAAGILLTGVGMVRTTRTISRLRAQLSDTVAQLHADELTGLANRRALWCAILSQQRAPGQWSLLLVDVDQFKFINDTYGHAAGDAALIRVAATLAEFAAEHQGSAFRLHGDEFAVVLPYLAREALAAAHTCIARVRRPVHVFAHVYGQVSVSIGVASGSEIICAEELLRRADAALYRAKRGRGRAAIWDPSTPESANRPSISPMVAPAVGSAMGEAWPQRRRRRRDVPLFSTPPDGLLRLADTAIPPGDIGR